MVFLALANFLMEMSVVLFTPMILSLASTASLGLVMTLGGIGYLVGSVVMSIWGCQKRRIHTVMVSMLLMGVFMTLIGLRTFLPLVMVSVGLCMFFLPITVSANQAIWQNRVAPDVQGRVFSIRQAIIQATPLLAYLLTGPLTDKVFEPLLKAGGPLVGNVGQIIGVGQGRGAGLLFICAGLFLVITSAIGYLSPHLRQVDDEFPAKAPGKVTAMKSRKFSINQPECNCLPNELNRPICRKENHMEYNLSTKMKPTYRTRSLNNLLRMGHCAPAVMQIILDINHSKQDGLVKLMAAMPGGIGNTGFECGAITSPLVILGLRHGLREMRHGLPLIFDLGYAYYQRFFNENAASFCSVIQNPRFPVGCIHAVRHSPELLAETIDCDHRPAIPAKQREAYSCLYGSMKQCNFHWRVCCISAIGDTIPVDQELIDASSAFIGGTLFKGITCSAYTAGVMAIGMKLGEIENSYLRVTRMLALMMSGGDTFSGWIEQIRSGAENRAPPIKMVPHGIWEHPMPGHHSM